MVGVVRRLRGTLVAEGSLDTRAHIAIALSRPGASSSNDDDEAWARALQALLGGNGPGAWTSTSQQVAGSRLSSIPLLRGSTHTASPGGIP